MKSLRARTSTHNSPYRIRRRFFKKRHGVAFAYIFGSRARNMAREDSDYNIAVFFRNNNVSVLDKITLAEDIAESLWVPVDRVDVVVLNKAVRF